MKNYFFLSGLPRAGSTLLSAILDQNPLIHAEGNSPVCQLLWDNHVSLTYTAAEQIKANRKEQTVKNIIKQIPDQYYANADKPYILDKCRAWTLQPNIELIREYITPAPKIIVLIRPIDEILKSFVNLFRENGLVSGSLIDKFLQDESGPIVRPYDGVLNAISHANKETFLFVSYKDLAGKTEQTVARIYEFLGLDNFSHDLNNITQTHKEDDSVYGLNGQHDVRSSINVRQLEVSLPDDVMAICQKLNEQIGL
jgi:sulfotransferase